MGLIQKNSSLNSKNQQLVQKIENGTVIDHIPQGMSLAIYELLHKRIALDPKKTRTVILTSTESKKYGKKDLIKIENTYPTKSEIDLIAILAPTATIVTIKNWEVVEKYKVEIPDLVPEGVLKCPNQACITYNGHEPVKAKFRVNRVDDTTSLQCWYCGRNLEGAILQYLE
ncbi:MAG: aspartate carbamoyltransferase regulatory subunit [Candidatus Aenigmarchaeota archaeon]|nr:aspartate carbamoyltransferase regulatory subunit [Candidatus Aenigmarchaeota archaeon]